MIAAHASKRFPETGIGERWDRSGDRGESIHFITMRLSRYLLGRNEAAVAAGG
jgi:hypothetical protein